ncbi:hypothetical protein GS429_07300 [Natronorubrum sp. JWXQ-INN-674]|uniref:Glycosyltransferase RgtA/B/C/D-like domain-containing protein n=1 Tax=Natronorubrum halalkaliphilum TaxID=2691917 RepID=A0A6B0VL78_9EURY|nr:hypothetical protein [Natronorubrum halalkaliphilum]MXV61867.1 hypothetical protein [Natronorubrum halalkaliphilum]
MHYNSDDLPIGEKKLFGKIIVFTFLLLLSIVIILYRENGFQRTSTIFYLTFALYLLTALHIFTQPKPVLSLVMILIAGITNRLTAYYSSSLYNGVDIYTHSNYIKSITANGSLEVFATSKYFYAPFYHILASSAELIYAVPTRDAIVLTTLIAVTVLPMLAVYLITIQFWNSTNSLVAGFLYITTDHAIGWGIHVIPTSLGLVFFSLLFLSLMKYVCWRRKRQLILAIAMMTALMFTHQVSLFIAITATVAFAISTVIYQLNISRIEVNIGLLAGLTMFIDFVVTKYSGPQGTASFFDVVLGNLFISLMGAGTEARTEVAVPQDPSISPSGAAALTLPQVVGSAILLTFAIVGALYWLSNRRENDALFIGIGLSTVTTVLLFVTLVGPVIGLRNLLPSRWWAFIYIFLAVLAAPGLIATINIGSKLFVPILNLSNFQNVTIILILIVVPYIALMGGNYAGASDDPLLDDAPGAEEMKVTDSEKQLFEHAIEYQDSTNILADRRASAIFSRYYGVPANTLSIDLDSQEHIQEPSIVINREYIHTRHSQYEIRTEQAIHVVHGRFPITELPTTSKQPIYNSGNHEITHISF